MKMKKNTSIAIQLPGAMAFAAAGAATQANAATVQITFANHIASSSPGLSNFDGDVTGDGNVDIIKTADTYGWVGVCSLSFEGLASARMTRTGYKGGVGGMSRVMGPQDSMRGLARIALTDGRINNGNTFEGWLDMTASVNYNVFQVQIHRLIFDDAGTSAPTGVTSATTGLNSWVAPLAGGGTSAVPEASTSLGLLALGAGGLLTRRRQKRAA